VRLAVTLFVALAMLAGTGTRALAASGVLKVCQDPNNLPFSNTRGEGIENRIAEVFGKALGLPVTYYSFPQRMNFVRNTLRYKLPGQDYPCDIVMGVPVGYDQVSVTKPYYRSTYVFVTRRGDGVRIRSFDDPQLRALRVGVELVGDDGANTPPAHALSRRGIVNNIVGFSVYGDYRSNSPPSAIIAAVARGDVDVAAAWGPMAGYFAARQSVALDVVPVQPQIDGRFLPQTFSIAMATRRRDNVRHAQLEQFIERRRKDIDAILAEYHIPRVDRGPTGVDRGPTGSAPHEDGTR